MDLSIPSLSNLTPAPPSSSHPTQTSPSTPVFEPSSTSSLQQIEALQQRIRVLEESQKNFLAQLFVQSNPDNNSLEHRIESLRLEEVRNRRSGSLVDQQSLQIDSLEEQNKKLSEQILYLQKQLGDLQELHQKLTQKNSELNSQKEQLMHSLQAALSTNSELTQQNQNLEQLISELEGKIKELPLNHDTNHKERIQKIRSLIADLETLHKDPTSPISQPLDDHKEQA